MRDQVSEQIKQYIIEGRLMPGDRLPTENQLAEMFGISRLSVRDATKLQELVDQFRTARDLKSCIAIDIQFHGTLMEASGLQPIVAINELLVVFFQRFYDAIKKIDLEVGIEQHQRLVDLLAAGQLDAAIADLREHIEDNKNRL